MKQIVFLGLTAITLGLGACAGAPEGTKTEATAAEETTATATGTTYNVDVATSLVKWEGAKPTGKHSGDLKIKSGSLTVADNAVTGGTFEIDMNSINCTDLTGEEKGKLEGHLKSPDFFDTAKFPTAKFELTKVEADKVTGNLTLRDQTKSITFPATVKVEGDAVTADAPQFVVDRTQFGVTYSSKTIDASLKDKFINDEIGISFQLQAKK